MKGCAFEEIVEVIGDRWSLLLVNALLPGPRRTTELATRLAPISTRTLAERLKRLEAAGVLTRHAYAEAPPRVEYALTKRGYALREVLAALRESAADWELCACDGEPCGICRAPEKACAEAAIAPAGSTESSRSRTVDVTLL
jgi:DNA-binding HxlR family transcriptional regulator